MHGSAISFRHTGHSSSSPACVRGGGQVRQQGWAHRAASQQVRPCLLHVLLLPACVMQAGTLPGGREQVETQVGNPSMPTRSGGEEHTAPWPSPSAAPPAAPQPRASAGRVCPAGRGRRGPLRAPGRGGSKSAVARRQVVKERRTEDATGQAAPSRLAHCCFCSPRHRRQPAVAQQAPTWRRRSRISSTAVYCCSRVPSRRCRSMTARPAAGKDAFA